MNKELQERWKTIDKYIEKHYKNYTKENQETKDNLQDIFNELNVEGMDLNKNIPKDKKSRLDRKINKILSKTPKDTYIYYKLSAMLKAKKITYRDFLEALIDYVYAEERIRLDEYESVLFQEVIEYSYNTAVGEIKRGLPPKKRKRISLFDMEIFYLLMNIPLLYGTREAYMWALAETQAQELYKLLLTSIQMKSQIDINDKKIALLLQKQQNRYLKPDTHSGTIENMVESYYNLAYLQAGLDNNAKKVRFIATMDDKTTQMCESLDNQTFYIDKMNVYQRYSDYDGAIVTYHTKGLVLGENLPPIMNHFHWCRSTITYLLNIRGTEDYDPSFFVEKIDMNRVDKYIEMYENSIRDKDVEHMYVIQPTGDVYHFVGDEDNVTAKYIDMEDAIVLHNHPRKHDIHTLSNLDRSDFYDSKVARYRGTDYKYTYEFNKDPKFKEKMPTMDTIYKDDSRGYHRSNIEYSYRYNIGYKRWKNE